MIPTLIRNNKALYIFACCILFGSFVFNIFGADLYPGWFETFDNWSENLVLSSIRCAEQGRYTGGLTNSPDNPDSGTPPNSCDRYVSQLGLQGYVYSVIPRIAHNDTRRIDQLVKLARVLLAVLLGLVLLAFIYFVHREFGKPIAYIVTVLLSLSFWPIGYSNNLYWVAFLLFVPFVYSLLAYPKLNQTTKRLWIYYGTLGGVLFLKFLTGYEFISVLTIGVATPIIYWGVIQKTDTKLILKRIIITGLVGVLAFGCALGVNIISLKGNFGSYKQAALAVEQRGEYRTTDTSRFYPHTVSNFDWTLPTLYGTISRFDSLDKYASGKGNPMVYKAILLINYSFLPLLTIPIAFNNNLLTIVMQSFALWFFASIYFLYFARRKGLVPKRQVDALMWSAGAATIGVMSWFIIAPGHVYEHAHLDAIIYYLPLALWLYIAVALACNYFIKSLWHARIK